MSNTKESELLKEVDILRRELDKKDKTISTQKRLIEEANEEFNKYEEKLKEVARQEIECGKKIKVVEENYKISIDNAFKDIVRLKKENKNLSRQAFIWWLLFLVSLIVNIANWL